MSNYRVALLAAAVASVAARNAVMAQPCAQEIVLRDSIGTTAAWTDGNLPFGKNYRITGGGTWHFVRIPITAPQALVLTEIRFIGAQATGAALSFQNYDYWVHIWSSEAALISNPHVGDVGDFFFDTPTAGPTPFGTTGAIPGVIGVKLTYDFRFDIRNHNIALLAGQSVILAVEGEIDTTTYGRLGVMESVEQGSSDFMCTFDNPPPSCYDLSDSTWHMHSARAAVQIKAQESVALTGDLDLDGDVDSADVELFMGCMTRHGYPKPDCDPAVFAGADFDGDGDGDMSDFGVLQARIGKTCP